MSIPARLGRYSKPICLYVTPLRKDSGVVIDPSLAGHGSFASESVAEILSVRAVPVYSATVGRGSGKVD